MKSSPRIYLKLLVGGVVVIVAAGVALYLAKSLANQETSGPVIPNTPTKLINLPGCQIAEQEIARLNLSCAVLSGAEQVDVGQCLALLDQITTKVRSETERHIYRFRRAPAEFENSEGFFRMLMLTVVLAEDFKIQYDPERKNSSQTATESDGFFSDASSVFLPGLLGPKRQGTCSSIPVLYVAVGRRLGYPLKLVTTKGHLFVRWEGTGERFNVEATSHGLNRFDDDYYRHWPFEISPSEEVAEGYLKSLTPAEELAVFLSIRGMCERQAGRWLDAAESFAMAAKLAPGCASYHDMASRSRAMVSK